MKTLALVIGNDDYHQSAKLSNAVNDANAIKSEFERLGFDVISKTNCKATDISAIYQEFSEKISKTVNQLRFSEKGATYGKEYL